MIPKKNLSSKKSINQFNTNTKVIIKSENIKRQIKAKSKTSTGLPDNIQFKYMSWNNPSEQPLEVVKKQIIPITNEKVI